MDAIELRMGDLRRYIITMIDEHSDYALALAVPSLNSDITSHFFSKATKLFPVAIRQVVTDNGKEFLGNFDKTLQEASIKHIWTYPYTPKMNATCERFNRTLREGANKQVISSQADSLIKISRIWADFFPANTSNQPI